MSETKTITKPKSRGKLWTKVVKNLFSEPAIIIVGSYEEGDRGIWKTGKTDFALKLSEDLMDLGIINEVSTNIDTSGDYKYISDLQTLKYWLHRNKETKLYIFDEANIHLPSRRAMSNKSVDIIQLFPEISKARAKMIVIGQKVSSLDSELRKKGWVKGTFLKLSLKSVYIRYRNEEIIFNDLPRTSIKFDPYLQAPFTLKPTDSVFIDDENLAKLERWAKGGTWRDEFTHQMQCNRFVRAQIIRLIEMVSRVTHTRG